MSESQPKRVLDPTKLFARISSDGFQGIKQLKLPATSKMGAFFGPKSLNAAGTLFFQGKELNPDHTAEQSGVPLGVIVDFQFVPGPSSGASATSRAATSSPAVDSTTGEQKQPLKPAAVPQKAASPPQSRPQGPVKIPVVQGGTHNPQATQPKSSPKALPAPTPTSETSTPQVEPAPSMQQDPSLHRPQLPSQRPPTPQAQTQPAAPQRHTPPVQEAASVQRFAVSHEATPQKVETTPPWPQQQPSRVSPGRQQYVIPRVEPQYELNQPDAHPISRKTPPRQPPPVEQELRRDPPPTKPDAEQIRKAQEIGHVSAKEASPPQSGAPAIANIAGPGRHSLGPGRRMLPSSKPGAQATTLNPWPDNSPYDFMRPSHPALQHSYQQQFPPNATMMAGFYQHSPDKIGFEYLPPVDLSGQQPPQVFGYGYGAAVQSPPASTRNKYGTVAGGLMPPHLTPNGAGMPPQHPSRQQYCYPQTAAEMTSPQQQPNIAPPAGPSQKEFDLLRDEVNLLKEEIQSERSHREELSGLMKQIVTMFASQMQELKNAKAEDAAFTEHQKMLDQLKQQRKQHAAKVLREGSPE